MMGAAARGVDSEDGYILGIAPRFFDKPGVLYENCSEFIFTETMRERKKLLEERSDATIVTPGGIGTYEEFFEILTLKSLHRLDRPIVLYNINGYYDGMKALLQHTADEKFMDVANMELCAFMDASGADPYIHRKLSKTIGTNEGIKDEKSITLPVIRIRLRTDIYDECNRLFI